MSLTSGYGGVLIYGTCIDVPRVRLSSAFSRHDRKHESTTDLFSRAAISLLPSYAYVMEARNDTQTEDASAATAGGTHGSFHNRRISGNIVQQGTGNAARDHYSGNSLTRLLYIV